MTQFLRLKPTIIVTLFLFTLFSSFNSALAGGPPMLPTDIVEKLVSEGAAEWVDEVRKPGDRLVVPRAFACKGCGDLTFANEGIVFENSQSCDGCGTPRTKKKKNIKWFRMPIHLNGAKVRYLRPTSLSGMVSETQKKILAFLKLDLATCDSCGRLNGKVVGKDCYGCGTPIPEESDEDKKKRKQQNKTAARAPKVGSKNMRANQEVARRMQAKQADPNVQSSSPHDHSQHGGATGKSSSIRTSGVSKFSSILNLHGKKIAMGGGAVIGVSAVALTIIYLSEKSEVHSSLGRVISVDEERAIVQIPGLKDIELEFGSSDNSPEGFDSEAESSIDYMLGDLIDVYWTAGEGVVAIVPRSLGAAEHLRSLSQEGAQP